MPETVFCQITCRAISSTACRELQSSHESIDCFGCGATSRLCARCRKYPLIKPEIDLCRECLQEALSKERHVSRRDLGQRHRPTFCQIMEGEISPQTCLEEQGVSLCNQCPSPHRLCAHCDKRVVHYPQYGQCLRCAVTHYAPDWEMKSAPSSPDKSSESAIVDPAATYDVMSTDDADEAESAERRPKAKQLRLMLKDWEALRSLGTNRFLSSEQVGRLCGWRPSTADARLRRMSKLDLVDVVSVYLSPTPTFPRHVFTLGTEGARLILAEGVKPFRIKARSDRTWWRSRLGHRYCVNEFYTCLVEAIRDSPLELAVWETEEMLRGVSGFKNMSKLSIVNCPRDIVGQDGKWKPTLYLIPNAYFELRKPESGRIYPFFLIVDLANKPLTMWKRRARSYVAYAHRPNCYQRQFDRDAFHLVIVTNPYFRARSRHRSIAESIREEIDQSDLQLFLITTQPDASEYTPLGKIWRTPAEAADSQFLVQ